MYTVTITDARGCTATVKVTVDLMVGTEEAEGQAYALYPNPAADWVRVILPAAGNRPGGRLVLHDAAGREVRSQATDGGAVQQMSLWSLPAGHYRLSVMDGARVLWVGSLLRR
jgi:hypothetical protein